MKKPHQWILTLIIGGCFFSTPAWALRCAPPNLTRSIEQLQRNQTDFLIAIGQFSPDSPQAVAQGKALTWRFNGLAFTANGEPIPSPQRLIIERVGPRKQGSIKWPQENNSYIALIELSPAPHLTISACGAQLFGANPQNTQILDTFLKSKTVDRYASPDHLKTQHAQ